MLMPQFAITNSNADIVDEDCLTYVDGLDLHTKKKSYTIKVEWEADNEQWTGTVAHD